MKPILDILLLIVFFVTYKVFDIYIATISLIAGSIVQNIILWLVYKKVDKKDLIILAIVIAFGSLTLLFHSDVFIKWKVSVINIIFALVLLISQLNGKSIIKNILEKNIKAPNTIWKNISHFWSIVFTTIAALNLYIAYNFTQSQWVNFKIFGIMGITAVSVFITGAYLSKYINKIK